MIKGIWKFLFNAWLDLTPLGKGLIILPLIWVGLAASITFIIGLIVIVIHKQFLKKDAKKYFNNFNI